MRMYNQLLIAFHISIGSLVSIAIIGTIIIIAAILNYKPRTLVTLVMS